LCNLFIFNFAVVIIERVSISGQEAWKGSFKEPCEGTTRYLQISYSEEKLHFIP